MARPIWTGSITFGLVSVPVGLYSATTDHDVSFHQFEKGTDNRIRYRRVNEKTGKEVEYDDIVKGADVGGGRYVMLDQEELDSVAPGRSRSLEIHQFVDLGEIDPIYYQKTYYLAPGNDEAIKTYALLRDAMSDADRAAIGTLVMRGKEYLAAIRPDGDLLVLQTMFFADEVRDPKDEIDRIPGRAKAKPAELAMAGQLIDSMSGKWKPDEYRDTYTDRVNELIKAKGAGREIEVAEEAPQPTNVTDLLEVLRRSVDAAKQRRGGGAKSTATKAAKAAPARTASKASPAKGAPRKGATRSAPAKATDVAAMSRTELAGLARELDVAGRSSMSRPALEKAVRKAQRAS
jgi:DNA end-binding protein Ku